MRFWLMPIADGSSAAELTRRPEERRCTGCWKPRDVISRLCSALRAMVFVFKLKGIFRLPKNERQGRAYGILPCLETLPGKQQKQGGLRRPCLAFLSRATPGLFLSPSLYVNQ